MAGKTFLIYPSEGRWAWATLNGTAVASEGVANSRAEAAAMVIRSIVRATTGDPTAGPANLQSLAAA